MKSIQLQIVPLVRLNQPSTAFLYQALLSLIKKTHINMSLVCKADCVALPPRHSLSSLSTPTTIVELPKMSASSNASPHEVPDAPLDSTSARNSAILFMLDSRYRRRLSHL